MAEDVNDQDVQLAGQEYLKQKCFSPRKGQVSSVHTGSKRYKPRWPKGM